MLADESRHDQRQFINRSPVRARGASKTARSARTPRLAAKRSPVVYVAIAVLAIPGLVCSPAAHGQQRPAPPLDPGAVKSRLVVRSVKGDEMLMAHPTSLGPGQKLDLGKLLASAEALSREELPGVLKSFGLEGSSRPLDIAAVDRVLESIPEDGRSNAEFFVGWFVKNHGQPTLARKYLMHADRSEHTLSWYSFLAKDALKRMEAK